MSSEMDDQARAKMIAAMGKEGNRLLTEVRLLKRENTLPDARIETLVADFQILLSNGELAWERGEPGQVVLSRMRNGVKVTRLVPRLERHIVYALGVLVRARDPE
jgi:hypothetical protein